MTTLLPCFNHLASSLLAGLPSTPIPRPLFTCQRHHLKSDKIKLLALQPRLKETQTCPCAPLLPSFYRQSKPWLHRHQWSLSSPTGQVTPATSALFSIQRLNSITPPPREISLITSPPAVKLHEAKNSVYSLLALPAAPTRKKLPHLSDERLH